MGHYWNFTYLSRMWSSTNQYVKFLTDQKFIAVTRFVHCFSGYYKFTGTWDFESRDPITKDILLKYSVNRVSTVTEKKRRLAVCKISGGSSVKMPASKKMKEVLELDVSAIFPREKSEKMLPRIAGIDEKSREFGISGFRNATGYEIELIQKFLGK